MLDIKLFRQNQELIKKSEKKRFKSPEAVDGVINYDNLWRKELQKVEKLRAQRNKVSHEINRLKKQGKSANIIIKSMREVVKKIDSAKTKADKYIIERDKHRYLVGNILHNSVPTSKTEAGNKVVRKWGRIPTFRFKPKHQADLILNIDGADIDKAARVSGSRFYYLKNELAMLNFAVLRLATDHLVKNRFVPMWIPLLLRHESMKAAAELADFEEQLYKIEGEDLYLIATSEQSLASYHIGDTLKWKDLPKNYMSYSPCFRREAGSHGKDTKGIFRTHQFDKVEQYVFCHPNDSWKWHEKMTGIAEDIYKALEIPYKVVNIASGEMNDNGAKKYDIEGWFPSQKKYRELGSGTNCTDYQARKLNTKFIDKNNSVSFVHTLNCTAVASERTIACLIENHQQADGSVKIPKSLWKYTGFKVIKPKI